MKPIAVVTNDISETFQWLIKTCGVDKILVPNRTATNTKTGQVYILILEKEQAYSWEFSGMLVYPLYESLEQVVRSRIR